MRLIYRAIGRCFFDRLDFFLEREFFLRANWCKKGRRLNYCEINIVSLLKLMDDNVDFMGFKN